MTFAAPIRDIRFALKHAVGFDEHILAAGLWPDLAGEDVDAILTEAGRMAAQVLAPLNQVGDKQGLSFENGVVRTPDGFAQAYKTFCEGGWGALAFNPDYGGQGLPRTLNAPVLEMTQAANMAFGLCPMLTVGAIEALEAFGADELKDLYLEKLITGEWSGAMCLTEPQAGSDVGAIRSKATRQEDGTYRIEGQKIYITWGEHDMAENVIHLVLARLPGAPEGSTRGLTLFLVPKFLVNPDGSLGDRNDFRCTGLEHKLGIHASPTCTMQFGENGACIGWLVGEENKGMRAMFAMMNNARLNVGLQGVGIAERAYQRALAYAIDRKQGKPFGMQHEMRDMIPIIQHADVRRMLATMKAKIEAGRAIAYANAMAIDLALRSEDEATRAFWKGREEFLTPITKAWCTDMGVEVASIGVQVHGGMGYVEETGAAQHLRDARIAPIYEGTNGIQAVDLAVRKLSMDGGASAAAFLDEARQTAAALGDLGDPKLDKIGLLLRDGVKAADTATHALLDEAKMSSACVLAGATPYLRLIGAVAGAHFLAKGALGAVKEKAGANGAASYFDARIHLAHFFAEQILPAAAAELSAVLAGGASLDVFDAETLGAA